MCNLALKGPEPYFVMVDSWEAMQSEYQATAKVLDHFHHEINEKMGGVDDGTGQKVRSVY
jgi:nicotinamide mononucleotide adenylyltransferase